MEADYIKMGNCLDLMRELPSECIDLTVTSPPYDNMRDYNGYSFDFEPIARELYRITKDGGVVVWIVSDGVENGSETGTSFRQALFFKDCGFNINDTMIWQKECFTFPDSVRYPQVFEYMFVFSKGKAKTVNLIKDRENIRHGESLSGTTYRCKDGSTKPIRKNAPTTVAEFGARFNVWNIPSEKSNNTGHPAVFPKRIAIDHIKTWSNEGDTVLDPFLGSGTTALAAIEMGRHYIGFEISEDYFEICKSRIDSATAQTRLF